MAARLIGQASGVYTGFHLLEFDVGRAASVVDTGWDFEKGDVILHCYVDVTTAEATASTKTIDVGILASESGGDEDGFLDGVATSAVGVFGMDATATDGTNQNYFAAAPKLGALMRAGDLGGDAAGTAAALIPRPHVCDGVAKSLTYTLGGAATELVAKGYVVFLRFPSRLSY